MSLRDYGSGDACSSGALDGVYTTKPGDSVSWFQPDPLVSLRLLIAAAPPPRSVIDVGAGTSALPDRLLDQGWSDDHRARRLR